MALTLVEQGGIDYSQLVNLTNGQIKFPAIQNPSSNANTLDDYSEGTWTPAFAGAGGGTITSYSLQSGTYVKIGRLVYVTFGIQVNVKGSVTGQLELTGLPFVISNAFGAFSLAYWNNFATNWVYMGLEIRNGNSFASFFGTTAAAGSSANGVSAATDFANGVSFEGSGTYIATN